MADGKMVDLASSLAWWAASSSYFPTSSATVLGLSSIFLAEGWIPLAYLGMCSLSTLLPRVVALDWGSYHRRQRRCLQTLLPLLPSVSGWPMLVQRLRCVLEAVPGVGSCCISKVWACSGKGKVDRLLFR
ncbi:hypothetical protein PVAP13_4KG037258 [Panicum virgatum]|uniref:Uncharacterized protein n=1 Tax=Panicum virgatum TaxID=38727 RepID=A0A8T0TIB4_PANVG|nr:hypothetical protein PVAP13_4KG037258 [Panicum virgatum]